MRRYRDALRQRAEEDERRLFYVALTRARERLYCTSAWWYGAEDRRGPSVFCDEVLSHPDVVEILPGHLDEADAPADNPVVDAIRREAVWPPHPELDPVATPWVQRVEDVLAGRAPLDELLRVPGAEDLYAEHVRGVRALVGADEGPQPGVVVSSLSATAAVRIASGKESASSVLHPLPERPSRAQRVGTEVHAWIEERSRGLVGAADEEALSEGAAPARRSDIDRLRANYVEMGYDSRPLALLDGGEPMAELPFTLKVGGTLVRGRIDAVFDDRDTLEVVDFKTGAPPDEADWGQLELYAEALGQLGIASGPLTLTYAYLQTGEARSVTYTPRGLGWLETALGTRLPARA